MNSMMSVHLLRPARATAARNLRFTRLYHPTIGVATARPRSSAVDLSLQCSSSNHPNSILRTLNTARHGSILGSVRLYSTAPPHLPPTSSNEKPTEKDVAQPELRESPWTIPNALTTMRILACPVLGYFVVKGEFEWATGLLIACGFSDWLDGWIARRFNMRSVFGTILDPAADKTLMTTLVVTLAIKGLLPVPLAVIIIGRDVLLSLSAFYYRYISLPPPKTFARYWDFGIPSAEVKPTQISKYNTALQLLLMGVTTVSPLLTVDIGLALQGLQWVVAGTTIWSGLSYVGRKGVNIIKK